jgi:hypothetical protein
VDTAGAPFAGAAHTKDFIILIEKGIILVSLMVGTQPRKRHAAQHVCVTFPRKKSERVYAPAQEARRPRGPVPALPSDAETAANRVKILFTSVGNEDDLIESANSFNIHPSLLAYDGLMLPLPCMVTHQTDIQRTGSA